MLYGSGSGLLGSSTPGFKLDVIFFSVLHLRYDGLERARDPLV